MATEYNKPASFKALDSITGIYTSALKLVYPAARDIAQELEGYASEFMTNAKARIDGLVLKVQHLNWEQQKLEDEAEEARKGTAEAVETIHKFLRGNGLEDLLNYRAEDDARLVDSSAPAE